MFDIFNELVQEGNLLSGYNLITLAVILVIIGSIFLLRSLKIYNLSFGTEVLIGLCSGVVFGLILALIKGFISDDKLLLGLDAGVSWLSLIGNTFTGLLKMIVVPLIFVMVATAIINMPTGTKKVKQWITRVVGLLVAFSLIGAVIGIITSLIFGLDASSITQTEEIAIRAETLQNYQQSIDNSLIGLLNSFIPGNPFADLAGTRSTSMIGVVIFSALLGFGGYITLTKDPKSGNVFKNVMNSIKDVIMVVVNAIIRLTPYGVFAIIAKTIYGTNFKAILDLLLFAAASYFAIIVTFIILLAIITLFGLSPVTYIKKTWETLVFAFSSRSSAATVPKTYSTQANALGVEDGLASLSSSLGASIGQVGWAGIYPAMLAVMIAVSNNQEISVAFIIQLLLVIAVTSFAVAGVGGGATNAAIIVLVSMGLPVTLAAVLISIEPIIDMARTALNVNGAITAGTITGVTTKSLDREVYNSTIATDV